MSAGSKIERLAEWYAPPMIELSNAALPELRRRGVSVPAYDRTTMQPGVVHFGPGAFHRVHQAWYFERALERDPRWGICTVALQTSNVRDALAPQDGLYTLAILGAAPDTSIDAADSTARLEVPAARRFEIVGSICELLVARESPAEVVRRLADPRTKLITATVTEKGYCLRSDGSLDSAHPDIAHDFDYPDAPRSLIGYLVAGLRMRRALGLAPPIVVSCDNLTDNGRRLRRGVLDFCERADQELAAWIAAEVAFPASMVDSITPASDDALRTLVRASIGVEDRWPVQREAFTQWVIEDDLRGAQPDWGAMGVTITDDVRGFERAKLRLLNGAHSTLAYLGSLAGYVTVAEAMRDNTLYELIRRTMIEDIVPTLHAPRGLDLQAYIESVLRRFRNPAIRHQLAQIAWDGSQKLPFRLLGTIADRLTQGASIARLAIPIAAWMQFIRRKALKGERATDPLAEELFAIGTSTTGSAIDVDAFLGLEKMFPRTLACNQAFRAAIRRAYVTLSEVESPETLARVSSEW